MPCNGVAHCEMVLTSTGDQGDTNTGIATAFVPPNFTPCPQLFSELAEVASIFHLSTFQRIYFLIMLSTF